MYDQYDVANYLHAAPPLIIPMIHLSVIVPVFNEQRTVEKILKKLVLSKDVWQIIIVDDGSRDHSAVIIKKFLEQHQIHTHRNSQIIFLKKQNGGKGSAIRRALPYVTGNYVLIQDADEEYDPREIPHLIEPIKSGRVKVVYGSRFAGPHMNLLFWNRVGNYILNFLVNILYNTTLSDMETCYKVIPTYILKMIDLKSKGFDIEPEITCKILKQKIHIYEVPISYIGRDVSEGKKITWVDAIHAFRVILLERLT